MSNADRKELLRAYKERKPVAGVYSIRNTESGRCLIGASTDVPAMLNRHRAQLKFGSCPDVDLQADWRRLGEDAFAFETLDELPPRDVPGDNTEADLRVLKALWLEKLNADGVALYARSNRL